MSALSNYLENKLVDHLLRGISYAPPATGFVALFTTPTSDAGGGTEVTGGGYVRAAVPLNATNWSGTQAAGSTTASTGTTGTTGNNLKIDFPLMPTATVTHWALYDAAVGGNMLFHTAMSEPVSVQATGSANFPINALTIAFD